MLQSELAANLLFLLTPKEVLQDPSVITDMTHNNWGDSPVGRFLLRVLRYNRLPIWSVRWLVKARGCWGICTSVSWLRDVKSSIKANPLRASPGMSGNFSVWQGNFHPSSVGQLVHTFLVYHSLTLDEFTKRKQKMSVKISFLLTFRIIQ